MKNTRFRVFIFPLKFRKLTPDNCETTFISTFDSIMMGVKLSCLLVKLQHKTYTYYRDL